MHQDETALHIVHNLLGRPVLEGCERASFGWAVVGDKIESVASLLWVGVDTMDHGSHLLPSHLLQPLNPDI
jgi:hypothetical protein